jgi:hypothetical protein
MLEKIVNGVALVSLSCLLLSSCSNFTQSGRQQAAYAKYVKKQSHNRVRQQVKFKKTKAPTIPPSDPKMSASAGEGGPQAMTSGQSQEQ